MAKKLEKFTLTVKKKRTRTTKYNKMYLECEKNLGYWTKFEKGADYDDTFRTPSRKSIYCGIKLASKYNNKPFRGIAVRNLTDNSFEVAVTAKKIKVGPGQKTIQINPPTAVDTSQVSTESIQANSVW